MNFIKIYYLCFLHNTHSFSVQQCENYFVCNIISTSIHLHEICQNTLSLFFFRHTFSNTGVQKQLCPWQKRLLQPSWTLFKYHLCLPHWLKCKTSLLSVWKKLECESTWSTLEMLIKFMRDKYEGRRKCCCVHQMEVLIYVLTLSMAMQIFCLHGQIWKNL